MAVEAAERGEADAAVVPLENSVAGPVSETLMALRGTMLRVRRSLYLRVRLVLARGGDSMVVYGHSHALTQAMGAIRERLPGAELRPATSTSEAADLAAREGAYYVCSPQAAESRGLEVVEPDAGGGYTRFIALEWVDDAERGERTMVIAAIPDEPGSLYRLLEPFARLGVNLTMIYSMPTGDSWRYLFYIEAEGSRLDGRLRAALAEASRRAFYLAVLGSYPVERGEA
jgi:prephenate dehydratase